MPSDIWKKTAEELPPPNEHKRVIGIWMASDGSPVTSIYTWHLGQWCEWDESWRTLVETEYWAYELEMALEVLGEY